MKDEGLLAYHMRDVLVLKADVLEQVRICPRLGIGLWIIDRDIDFQMAETRGADAFGASLAGAEPGPVANSVRRDD
jgi:hypothetical protein